MHSAEFKRDAIQLAHTSGNFSGTARDLGFNAPLLRKWMNTEQEQASAPSRGKENRI